MKQLIIIIFLAVNLQAQNVFFKPDESGMGLAFQIGSNDGSTILGINGSYTYKGRFTGGLTIGYESNDKQGFTSTGIHPHLDYLVLKQGVDEMPISVNLYTYYQYNTFDLKNYTGPSVTGNSFGFGTGLFYEIETNSKLIHLIPAIGLGYARNTVNVETVSQSSSGVAFSISPSVLFNKFYITPSLSFSDGKSAFNLLFGIVFSR